MATVKRDKIYDLARKVKAYVEKNYAIPSEIDGFRHGEYTYLFCLATHKGNKIFNRRGVRMATSPKGETLNQKIYASEYIRGAKKIIQFVEETGKLPNTLVVANRSIEANLYEYAYAKIIAYQAEHGKNPAYVTVNSNDLKKPEPPKPAHRKYGHATEPCCDDRGQNNGYYCGPHSLQEVFRNLTGIVVPQSTIASWASTTSAGTGHWGMDTAVAKFNSKYNKNLQVQWYNFSDLGWNGIKNIINSNDKDCIIHNLYRNEWGHYEVINKVYDDYCDVQNSLGSRCSSGCYYGYVEERYLSTFRSYINGISQKSVMVITND